MCREGFTSLKADRIGSAFFIRTANGKMQKWYTGSTFKITLNIFHMKRVNKYCTSPINNPITSSLSVDNAWVKQTIYASASIFTESTAILNLFSFRWSWSELRWIQNIVRARRRGRAGRWGGGGKCWDSRFFSCLYIFTHTFIASGCIWRNKERRRLRGERMKHPMTCSQSLFVLRHLHAYWQYTVSWRK